jgi:DNA anti-recombination protein RmuC
MVILSNPPEDTEADEIHDKLIKVTKQLETFLESYNMEDEFDGSVNSLNTLYNSMENDLKRFNKLIDKFEDLKNDELNHEMGNR